MVQVKVCRGDDSIGAIQLGRQLDVYKQILDYPEMITATQFYIGVDPAFGSSKFGLVVVCIIDKKVCVLEAIELERQEFGYCIGRITDIMIKELEEFR